MRVAQLCLTLCDPTDFSLLCPWDSPGKNTGVGCHSLLHGIFPCQGSNLGLPTADRLFTLWATRDLRPLEGYLYMIFRDTMHLRRRQILDSWVTRSCHMTPSGQCDVKGNFVSRTEVNFLLIYLPPASGSHCRCNGWSSAASLCPELMPSTGKLWARKKDGAWGHSGWRPSGFSSRRE